VHGYRVQGARYRYRVQIIVTSYKLQVQIIHNSNECQKNFLYITLSGTLAVRVDGITSASRRRSVGDLEPGSIIIGFEIEYYF